MDPYTILGVSTSATDQEIKRAYRNLVKRYHPDRRSPESSHEKIVLINQAYDILSDSEKRAQYDRRFTSSYYTSPVEEDPMEAYKREYKRKRWEREKKEREEELARKEDIFLAMRWVHFIVLIFGAVLIISDFLEGEGLMFWHTAMTGSAAYICYQRTPTDFAYKLAKWNLFVFAITLIVTFG